MKGENGGFVRSSTGSSHFADELTPKGVDDTGYGGGGTLADEVEIQHALHSSRLQTTVSKIRTGP